eukprot:195470-Hanusia_phi.AAC.1
MEGEEEEEELEGEEEEEEESCFTSLPAEELVHGLVVGDGSGLMEGSSAGLVDVVGVGLVLEQRLKRGVRGEE